MFKELAKNAAKLYFSKPYEFFSSFSVIKIPNQEQISCLIKNQK